jgi:hypothetical protein
LIWSDEAGVVAQTDGVRVADLTNSGMNRAISSWWKGSSST